jgi:hypothetical protein
MSIRTRLQRLEQLHRKKRPPAPERSKAKRWLDILRLAEPFMQEHAVDRLDRHRQAIALLAENIASGRLNAYIEHFCGCCLDGAMAWHHDLPHGGRLAFLEADHWARLHQAKQIGDSRHLVEEPGRGNSVAPWGSALGLASVAPTLAHVASGRAAADQTPPLVK